MTASKSACRCRFTASRCRTTGTCRQSSTGPWCSPRNSAADNFRPLPGRSGYQAAETRNASVQGQPLRSGHLDEPAGDKPLHFRTKAQSTDMSFIPLCSLFNQRYALYYRVG